MTVAFFVPCTNILIYLLTYFIAHIEMCAAEQRRKDVEDLHDELKTLKRRHATGIKVRADMF